MSRISFLLGFSLRVNAFLDEYNYSIQMYRYSTLNTSIVIGDAEEMTLEGG